MVNSGWPEVVHMFGRCTSGYTPEELNFDQEITDLAICFDGGWKDVERLKFVLSDDSIRYIGTYDFPTCHVVNEDPI